MARAKKAHYERLQIGSRYRVNGWSAAVRVSVYTFTGDQGVRDTSTSPCGGGGSTIVTCSAQKLSNVFSREKRETR